MKKVIETAGNTLRHKLGPRIVALDYPGLKIMAHSQTERFIRSHSAMKEPETVEWIESLPKGSTLWDVGANIGAYSLIAAKRGLRVVAFEPSPVNFHSLAENIRLNGLDVIALGVALGCISGLIRMRLSSDEAGAALHKLGSDSGLYVFRMSGRLAIHMGIPKPDYLKIDTDGGEVGVIDGLGEDLDHVKAFMIEDEHPLHIKGFKQKGRWPIKGFPCANVLFER